jgi:hypothetical protein
MGERMTLRDYGQQVGRNTLDLVLKKAGLTLQYFRLMAYDTKPCSPRTFEKIEKAARAVNPDILPDYEVCTRPTLRGVRLEAKEEARRAAARATVKFWQRQQVTNTV